MKSFISYTTAVIFAVDLLATSGDITMTWTSPMFSKLYSNDTTVNPLPKPITEAQDAWIASLINVGAMVGGFPFSFISEHYGRKAALLAVGVFHIIAYLSMAFAKCVELFYFGRILGGLAVGGGYTLLPMYIAEVAEEKKRGAYSVTLGIFWGFGNFLPYLIGPFLSVRVFNLINFSLPLLFVILFFFLGIETPYYLIGANKLEKAEEVLMLLRAKDRKSVQLELQNIKNSLEQEKHENVGSFTNIFTNPGVRKAFIISISLISFQQLSGWNAITFYLQPIFEASNTNLSPEICSLIIGACIFGFSLPTPYFTDKINRKVLLIFSDVGLGLGLLILGAFFYIKNRTNWSMTAISWIPIPTLIMCTFAFQVGLAALPWTISSEIFPKNVKKLSSTTTSASCWIVSFLITQFFNTMKQNLGTDGTFFFYAVFTFIASCFTFFYVPETRGKTFVEIQQILKS
ncbi:facilitated trehalose transporter Tret1-like isoform X2 [Diabrotica undecimpunctata]|uniref:facilitated trehalose transporter Tret1-like isoform X2 n=1 Tax=Diabrotica undecimpunctata TaxID=50387 RepID=UPI003B63998F